MTTASGAGAGGSSPLARGLPIECVARHIASRIIPARAGFTSSPLRSAAGAQDHPRSRGVYVYACTYPWGHRGSSPLARGLRTGRYRREPGARDHPRSRGVYAHTPTISPAPPGSSPLARGLRVLGDRAGEGCGIIPARAGFTPHGRNASSPPKDHPRSRGVYGKRFGWVGFPSGSSPLARGLLHVKQRRMIIPGIIPARAGFTRHAPGLTRCARDHPRSRGVYFGRTAPDGSHPGSSPLARGLPAGAQECTAGRGIIPARAGFTPVTHPLSAPDRDHPRSRGVYFLLTHAHNSVMGSSPLARGLPGGGLEPPLKTGIIPARAGFTRRRSGVHSGAWDHPRSRGVYLRLAYRPLGPVGSSPLARGLPVLGIEFPQRAGIIPARAGFTVSPSDRTAGRRDHPRSRGVY